MSRASVSPQMNKNSVENMMEVHLMNSCEEGYSLLIAPHRPDVLFHVFSGRLIHMYIMISSLFPLHFVKHKYMQFAQEILYITILFKHLTFNDCNKEYITFSNYC